MSMLWKKPKSGRFSRFMSEFQHSSKRGGSLFVETGFPTSLIDLFVKNRDRLKKSSTKRLKRNSEPAPTAFYSIKPDVVTKKHVYVPSKVEKINSVAVENNNKRANEKNVCVCVLMVVQIFIVSMLVLSTKKNLTLGITLSALALLFTEIVAARLLKCFKNADKIAVFREKTVDDLSSKKAAVSCLEEKTEFVAAKTEDLSKALRIRDLLMKDEKSKSKSSKLKSKIVNKLRSYEKKKKTIKVNEETLSAVSSEDTTVRIDEEQVLNPPLVVEESKGDQTNGIIVMMVIVLVGLLCGKILAIVFTLSCVLLKFGVAKKYGLCI